MSVRARKDSIQIDFYFRCHRCRETVSLEPTKANLCHVKNLLALIKHEIAINTFEFGNHFPNSKTHAAKLFGVACAGNKTVETALNEYYQVNHHRWKYSYKSDNQNIIHNQLIPAFRDVRLVDLSTAMIREWCSKLTCGNKRKNNILLPLSGMLKDAYIDGLIEFNPMDRLPDLKCRKKEPSPCTPNEVDKIIAALPDQANNYYQFAFYSGLRTGELIALHWSDIDLKNKIVRVWRNKTRKVVTTTKTPAGERYVTLFEPAIQALEQQKEFTFKIGEHVFYNPKRNKPWIDDGQLRKRFWIPALLKAGVAYRNQYQTRHTYASMMLMAGEPPIWVARQMGHSNPNIMFERYARWIPETNPNIGKKINALWSQNGH